MKKIRTAVAVRDVRRERARGVDGWLAAERRLGEMMPRRVARIVLYEPRVLVCLARWVLRRHPGGTPGHFRYNREKKPLVIVFIALLVFESLGMHAVLLAIFGSRWWIWALFDLDVYAMLWAFGFYGSMVVLPHRITDTELRLRYAYLAEFVVPREAILSARPNRRPEAKPGRVIVDGDEATFCCGETTVTLELDPAVELSFRDKPVGPVGRLHMTADDPHAFVTALTDSARPRRSQAV
ncbi:hypothetical protein [Kutzneria sp. 744]|uniref:hypothetical protein n=1 Tax=Kutzneria sp. (strain 744) TaxID=345341 RepID=UPI0012FC0D10|nr:hypothetical protein [Kutzneria sp. 744]